MSEKKPASCLVENDSIEKISVICDHIGVGYSGVGPDFRLLLKSFRKEAEAYFLQFGEYPPTHVISQKMAHIMQEFTQSGGVRPFGVSILLAGVDASGKASLYQIDPSGTFYAWKATAIGKNYVTSRTFLEKRHHDDMELEDAVHTALLTLKESFDGLITEQNIEVGIVDAQTRTFKRLTPVQIKEYLENL